MRSLVDFGEPDAWKVEKHIETNEDGFFKKIVILTPNQTVAGISDKKINFLIDFCVPLIETSTEVKGEAHILYTFQGYFGLGENFDFIGEYTFRFEASGLTEKCLVSPVADFSISKFEIEKGILLARALCWTLPRNLILYGALHDTEWVMEKWERATPDTVEIWRPRLL